MEHSTTAAIRRALYPEVPGLAQIPFRRGSDRYISTGLFRPGARRTVEECQTVISLLFDVDAVTLHKSDHLAEGLADLGSVKAYKQSLYKCSDQAIGEIKQRLADLTLPTLERILGAPSAVIDSGWGWHIYYLLGADVAQSKQRLSKLHQGIQKATGMAAVEATGRGDLATILDATHDVGARVARIIGSDNRRAPGRPRRCRIVSGDAERVLHLEHIQRAEAVLYPAPAPAPQPAPHKPEPPPATSTSAPAVLDWSAYTHNGQTFAELAEKLTPGQAIKVRCPFGGTSTGSGFLKMTDDGRRFYRSHPAQRTYWQEASPVAGRAALTRRQTRDGEDAGPANTISNVYRLLEQDDDIRLWFDTFRQRPMYGDQPLDLTRAQTAIRRLAQDRYRWSMKVTRDDVAVAITETAEATERNPLAERLDQLEWDGVARLADWIPTVLGVDPSPLYQAIARRWFLSVVARIYRPGCKVDTMLILQGRQGTYKSELFKTVAGFLADDLVLDTRLDWSNTTKSRHLLTGRLFYEDAELVSMQKASATELKNLLSVRTDTFIPPFGRAEVTRQRTAIIVGTTNEREILTDTTGARRFWIVDTEHSPYPRARLGELRRMLPQLYAEAVHAWKAGEQWWMTDAEQRLADVANQARTEADPLLEAAREVFDANTGGPAAGFTAQEFSEALLLRADTVRDRRLTARAVSKILQTAGFIRGRTYRHGQQCRVYYRPDLVSDDELTGLSVLGAVIPLHRKKA